MAELRDFDTTAANNTGAASAGWFAEGMDYDEVNNAARESQAIMARWYQDNNGALDSTGSAGAYVIAANQDLSGGLQRGDKISFEANHTNTGAATLNVDGTGAVAIQRKNGDALTGAEISSGGVYTCVYDGTVWQLEDPTISTVTDLNVTGTDAVDLTDNGNPLNIGTESGAHLAMSPAIVQAKGSATTSAALAVNPLGGAVITGNASGGSGQFRADAPAGSDTSFRMYENGVQQGSLFNDASLNMVRAQVAGSATVFRIDDGTNISAVFTPAGSQAFRYANTDVLATQSHTSNTTGGTIKHRDGGDYDIGMNLMPSLSIAAATTVAAEHCGKFINMNSSITRVFTVPSSVENGFTMTLAVTAGGVARFTPDGGVTLTWQDGAGGATGQRDVADGGVVTLYQRSANTWFIWGTGIS